MIDPLLALAFSVHSTKGVYALLLGSGVSRASGIPTGWEIVLDLIRKVAHLQNASCEPDPAAWYRQSFNEEPDYSVLLERLAASPAERQQILRRYFDPTDEERAEGLKAPTDAHRAIADLVSRGYIRVIVTTNFDRLLEKALEAIGVTPTVISSPDALEGALPLQHSACTIIKLHGDYMDTRIKNAPNELADYDARIQTVLDRIFDEYGLIVSGWSAEWDPALCSAIERCKSRRFTTYWSIRGELSDRAQRLVTLRSASIIPIQDADTFFRTMAEKVTSLEEFDRPHPLSVAAAVAQLKRYLVDPMQRIRLEDLFTGTIDTVTSECVSDRFSLNTPVNSESFAGRLKHYEALMEPLIALLSQGCYWGDEQQDSLWVRCLERLSRIERSPNGSFHETWQTMQRYPVLLGLYAAGLGAVAVERYATLSTLLLKPRIRDRYTSDETPLVYTIYAPNIVDDRAAKQSLPGFERHYTPVSDYLHKTLRAHLQSLLPDDRDYTMCFDRFEYLLALHHCYCSQKIEGHTQNHFPWGSFMWRTRRREKALQQLEQVVDSAAPAMLERGAFDGSMERLLAIKAGVHEQASNNTRIF